MNAKYDVYLQVGSIYESKNHYVPHIDYQLYYAKNKRNAWSVISENMVTLIHSLFFM
jgi:hypothetical protein